MRAALPAAVLSLALFLSCGSSPSGGAPDAAIDRSATDAACPAAGVVAPPQNPVCPDPDDLATWGPEVPVIAGMGDPPTPAGGTLAPGWYVLVAKTVYGSYLDEANPSTDLAPEIQALQSGYAREAAYIDCSSMVTEYTMDRVGNPDRVSQNCRSLVPRALPLAEIAYTPTASTDGILNTAPGLLSSYTASGDAVTLVSLLPAFDMNMRVVGSFTIVDRFVPASTFKPAMSVDSGAPIYDASPGPYAPGERDPRCPADPPAQGAPCDPEPVPLQCEYGGDALARCTTTASCLLFPLDGGGTFQFQVDTATDCPPNPPECPPDFASALALVDAGAPSADASALRGPACSYTQGICGFPEFDVNGACGWSCRQVADVGAGCPAPRPLAGTPCSDEGLKCSYSELCGRGFSFGSDMVCQYGHWARVGGVVLCPFASACSANTTDP